MGKADVSRITSCLAAFHKAARKIEEPNIYVTPPLTEVFAKQISLLKNNAKQLNRHTRLSDFDVLVLKNIEKYISLAEEAQQLLLKTAYLDLYKNAIENTHLCHSALKEETFILTDTTCYITRLENATINLQLTDLASILRRYARKSKRETPLSTLLCAYTSICPLPTDGKKILYAMLLFPWSFIRNVTQYYSKKRIFVPAATTTRMAEILTEQNVFDSFLSSI